MPVISRITVLALRAGLAHGICALLSAVRAVAGDYQQGPEGGMRLKTTPSGDQRAVRTLLGERRMLRSFVLLV